MSSGAAVTPPTSLPWTGDPEADRLIASDWVALLIGFVLDQQIPMVKAFAGPLELRRRLGHLDCHEIATMDPSVLRQAVAGPPALHRFPASMADRIQALCRVLVERYAGDPTAIWRDADADTVMRRLQELPGFSREKAATVLRLLTRQYGVPIEGADRYRLPYPTLGDVATPAELAEYLVAKRARKAAARERAASKDASQARTARR